MNNIFYVYEYIDPIINKPFYIGKGSNKRMMFHLNETYENTSNKKKWAYIKGLRNKGIEPIINIIKDKLSEDEAYNLEEELIKQHGRIGIDLSGTLTNIHIKARPPLRKGPRKPRAKGPDSPMYGKTCYDIWLDRYGEIEANRLENIRKEKIRISSTGRKMPKEVLLRMKNDGIRAKQVIGKIWISNDLLKIQKHIYPENLKDYDKNWYRGKTDYTGNKARGRKYWINNTEQQKQILIGEPIPMGWLKGPKSRSKGVNH